MARITPIPERRDRVALVRKYLASALALVDESTREFRDSPSDVDLDLAFEDLEKARAILAPMLDEIALAEEDES